MSPGDDAGSPKRRRKDERSRKEDRQHTSRSRSPTRKKHRRSESKRRKKQSKSRRRSYSSSSSSSSSLSSSQMEKKKRRKSKHSKHAKKRKHRHRNTRCSDESDSDSNDATTKISTMQNKSEIDNINESGDKKPIATEPKQPESKVQTESKGPMTQAQYLQLQSQVREVVDPATGRVRLVRGTGEIIERIVSRNEHQQLNAQATRGDGDGFARDIARQAMQRRMGR